MNEDNDIIRALQQEFSAHAEEISLQQDSRDGGVRMYAIFSGFLEAGFTRQEAMELLKTILLINFSNQKKEDK